MIVTTPLLGMVCYLSARIWHWHSLPVYKIWRLPLAVRAILLGASKFNMGHVTLSDHAHFKGDLSFVCWDLTYPIRCFQRSFVIRGLACTCYDQPIYEIRNLWPNPLQNTKGNTKIENGVIWGSSEHHPWFGVTQSLKVTRNGTIR